MKFREINIIGVMVLGWLSGCSTAEDLFEIEVAETKGYSFSADIVGYASLSSRAQRTDTGDLWDLKSFDRGDVAGFYSLYGNSAAEDGNGSFNNVPMTFTGNKFTNDDIIFNTDYFQPKTTFYYYPYQENVDYDPTHTRFEDDGYGIELRVKGEDGIDRYRDLLWVISATSATTASFGHVSSSIIFLRGEGFEKAENKMIKVVLTQGVSHAVIEDNLDYLKNIRFIYLDGYERDGKEMTEEDCRVWYAWEGQPYQVNEEGSLYNQQIFEDAQYIILPSSRSTSRLSVDYIQLYDNNGDLKTISNFNLYDNKKNLYYGQQYPLLIKMKELEATVVPVSIKSWGEDVTTEEEKGVGINSPDDFRKWFLQYNSYIASGRESSYEDELSKYGDKTITDGVTGWSFYLNNDLDLSRVIESGQKHILNQFDDILEGNKHTITGLQMECATPPAFIGTVGNKAVIKNLNISGMTMNVIETADSDKSENAGGFCKILNGTLDNCNIDGVVRAPGRKVGIIAGYADKEIVKGCKLSGIITGASTQSEGMFGEMGTSLSHTNNNASGLIFIESL